MNTIDAMERLAAVDPIDDRTLVEAIPEDAFDEIALSITTTRRSPERPKTGSLRARRVPRMAMAIGVACVVGALLMVTSTLNPWGDGTDVPSWNAELASLAQESPLVLMDPASWTAETITEGFSGTRSIRYREASSQKAGPRHLYLEWSNQPKDGFSDHLARKSAGYAKVLDTTATLYATARGPREREFEAVWEYEGFDLILSSVTSDQDDFRRILEQVEAVSLEEWLAAIPEGITISQGKG